MANPQNATTGKSGQRFYTWRDENYWSVTTIAKGGLPTPYGLQKWMKAATALGTIQEQEVIGAMLKSCETPDHCQKVRDYKQLCPDCTRIIDWLIGRPYTLTQKAADLGTYVHEAVEAYILGKPFPKWKEEARSRMLGFEGFLAEYEPTFEVAEESVFSRRYRYAGTLDAIATIDGRKFILDLKTGAKGIFPEVALQLAAYRYADFIGAPDGSEQPMPAVDAVAALSLPGEGFELVDIQADEDIHKVFLHVKEVFRWQQETSKNVRRGPLRRDRQGDLTELGMTLTGSVGGGAGSPVDNPASIGHPDEFA